MSQVRINFVPPTTRGGVPGSLPASEIAFYKVERLPNSGGSWSLYATVVAGEPVVVEVNSGDAHQYRLSTVDTAGRVSLPSSAIEVRFDALPVVLPPDPPTSLSLTIL
jgi:hypothetical protein